MVDKSSNGWTCYVRWFIEWKLSTRLLARTGSRRHHTTTREDLDPRSIDPTFSLYIVTIARLDLKLYENKMLVIACLHLIVAIVSQNVETIEYSMETIQTANKAVFPVIKNLAVGESFRYFKVFDIYIRTFACVIPNSFILHSLEPLIVPISRYLLTNQFIYIEPSNTTRNLI